MGLTSFDRYMNRVGKIPLLTPEEEIHLSALVQQMLPIRQKQQEGKRLTAKERRVLAAGLRAKERMITANLRLVVNISSRFVRHCAALTVDDLVQEGSIGLATAAERFDGTRGYKFSTYAYWWIRQCMNRSMIRKNRMIKLPHDIEGEVHRLRKLAGNLSHELGSWPTVAQLAEAAGITTARVAELLDYTLAHVSLDKPFTAQDEGLTFGDIIEDPTSVERLEQAERQYDLDRILLLLDSLKAEDQDLLRSRWGIGRPIESLRAMSKRLGYTRHVAADKADKALHRLQVLAAVGA